MFKQLVKVAFTFAALASVLVADFIGRANFLSGRWRGGEYDFGGFALPASLRHRSYLGESWDYLIEISELANTLRVTARPQEVFEVGAKAHAEIDTAKVTVIEPTGACRHDPSACRP